MEQVAQGYEATYNPKVKRVLSLRLSHSIFHEGYVLNTMPNKNYCANLRVKQNSKRRTVLAGRKISRNSLRSNHTTL